MRYLLFLTLSQRLFASLAAMEPVILLLPSSSFLRSHVENISITEPSAADSIGPLLNVLPVFLDVSLEVSVDQIPSEMDHTSVPLFLLRPTLWAGTETPIVVLDDIGFTNRDDPAPWCFRLLCRERRHTCVPSRHTQHPVQCA